MELFLYDKVRSYQTARQSTIDNRQSTIDNRQSTIDNRQSLYLFNLFTMLGFIGLVYSLVFISDKRLFPSFWALIPTASAALILYFYHPKTFVAKTLSLAPIVFIGKISYSLYLWHWPVIVLSRKYLFVEQFTSAKQYFIVAITTLILSLLTYYLIETPARKKKRSFKFSLIAYYLIPSLIILGVYEIQKKTKFLDFRYEKRMELYKLMKTPGYSEKTPSNCHSGINGDCLAGDLDKKSNIIAFGDSHTGHLFPYLNQVGIENGFSLHLIECGRFTFLKGQKTEERCIKMQPFFDKWLNESKVLIISQFYSMHLNDKFDNNLSYENNLISFLNQMKTEDKIVVFLLDTPALNADVQNKFFNDFLLFKTKNNKYDFLSNYERKGNELIENIANNYSNVYVFNPLHGLTSDQRADWPILNGFLTNSDTNHLNVLAARELLSLLPKQKAFWEQIAKEANEQEVKKE